MTYDAVIIGAGPAGAHLGYLLASAGATVALVDRAVFPRDKLCGGLLTEKTLMLLSASYPNELFKGFDIKQAHVLYKGEHIASLQLLSAVCTVRRYQFDTILVDLAVAQGVDTYLGDSVLNVDFINQKVYLKSGCTIQYKHLIGADGVLSKVRHLADLPANQMGFCMEAYVPWDQVKDKSYLQAGTIELFYGNNTTGYGWVFPSHESIVVGIGDIASKLSVANIVRSFPQFVNDITQTDSVKLRGAYIPSGSSVVLGNSNIENLFLIGDAAGLIDPFTGEGIYYALLSAKKAASVLLSNDPNIFAYNQHMSKTIAQIEDGVRVRDNVYNPVVLRSVLGTMLNRPQYSENLIDETIIRYAKPYMTAYKELQEYMR